MTHGSKVPYVLVNHNSMTELILFLVGDAGM